MLVIICNTDNFFCKLEFFWTKDKKLSLAIYSAFKLLDEWQEGHPPTLHQFCKVHCLINWKMDTWTCCVCRRVWSKVLADWRDDMTVTCEDRCLKVACSLWMNKSSFSSQELLACSKPITDVTCRSQQSGLFVRVRCSSSSRCYYCLLCNLCRVTVACNASQFHFHCTLNSTPTHNAYVVIKLQNWMPITNCLILSLMEYK